LKLVQVENNHPVLPLLAVISSVRICSSSTPSDN
jgi:hypothetical protein